MYTNVNLFGDGHIMTLYMYVGRLINNIQKIQSHILFSFQNYWEIDFTGRKVWKVRIL